MARPYMHQTTVTPESAPASWPPAPTRDEATGLTSAWFLCGKCGEYFMHTQSPRLAAIAPSGTCPTCEQRERQATEILRSRSEAISKQVEQKLAATAVERGARVDVQIQRLIDAERPRIAEELQHQDRQRFADDARAEEYGRILEELKAKGAQAI